MENKQEGTFTFGDLSPEESNKLFEELINLFGSPEALVKYVEETDPEGT